MEPYELDDACEEYVETLPIELDTLSGKIQQLDKALEAEKERIIATIEKEINELTESLTMYEAEIAILDSYDLKRHYDADRKVQSAIFENLKSQFDLAKMKARNIGEEQQNMVKIDEDEIVKQACKLGDKLFEKSIKRAKNILGNIKDSTALVADINVDIRAQNQKLLENEDIIADSQSHLKRAAVLVDYFSRAFYKDMVLKIMIFIISILIVGVIIFASMSKGSATQKSLAIKNTTNGVKTLESAKGLNCAEAKAVASASKNLNSMQISTHVNCLEGGVPLDGPSVEVPSTNPNKVVPKTEPKEVPVVPKTDPKVAPVVKKPARILQNGFVRTPENTLERRSLLDVMLGRD